MIKNKIKAFLPKGKFSRGVGILMGGTMSAQILLILASPILTRIFTPDDFGIMAIYIALLGLFSVVASLRYELAIPIPKTDQEASNIVTLSLLILLLTTALVSIVLMLYADNIAQLLGVPKLVNYFWLFPLSGFVAGLFQIFNYWAIRVGEFSNMAKGQMYQSLATLVVQLSLFKIGSLALLLGLTSGKVGSSFALSQGYLARKDLKKLTLENVKEAAVRFRRFPFFSTWSGLFNAGGRQLPALMFAALFSVSATGLFALAHQILFTPVTIIGQAVGNVFLSNAPLAYREGRLGSLVSKAHDKMAHLAMPPALILMMAGPEIFSLIFGERWLQSGEFARWMTPWLYIIFITSPFSTLTVVLEKQKQEMFFQAILLISRLGAIGIGAWSGDLLLTVILFSIASTLCWTGFLFWIFIQSGSGVTVIMQSMLSALTISVICVFPLALGLLSGLGTGMLIVTFIITGIAVSIRYWFLLRDLY